MCGGPRGRAASGAWFGAATAAVGPKALTLSRSRLRRKEPRLLPIKKPARIVEIQQAEIQGEKFYVSVPKEYIPRI